jgi:hypothetical protein
MIPEGIHPQIPDETYHRREVGTVSNTGLKFVRRSPAHYLAWAKGELEPEVTKALAFGRAFDCALLTPALFEEHYITRPKFSGKGMKAAKAEWEAAHAEQSPITFDDLLTIRRMVDSIRSHPLAAAMIRDGEPQMTLSWTDKESGLKCKSRLDYYVRSMSMIVDVKTAEDASEEGFRKAVTKYGYYTQDALYRFAADALDLPIQYFCFLAVEKTPPYAVATYTLDAESIGRGYSRVRQDIETLAQCMKTDRWPAYREAIVELSLPPWAA